MEHPIYNIRQSLNRSRRGHAKTLDTYKSYLSRRDSEHCALDTPQQTVPGRLWAHRQQVLNSLLLEICFRGVRY